ncbi:MAG: hypothetical protein Q7U05_03105 [Polaromonas sp.]|nr:hypothetical protein [Polaromonas sp.]
MLHIYGRIDCMYLGSEFHRYWARCGLQDKHPDDVAYLHDSPFVHDVRPCPFDGPLENAKVVICLANPNYGDGRDVAKLNQLVMNLRSGEEGLPEEFDDYYRSRIARPMGIPLELLRNQVAVLNICPYASARMSGEAIRSAAGLPSVWQAQKYLREVLIPRAQTENIYLLFIRKLQLWGVTQSLEEHGNLRVIKNLAISGVMPKILGQEIREWLVRKRYITNLNQCESEAHENSQV